MPSTTAPPAPAAVIDPPPETWNYGPGAQIYLLLDVWTRTISTVVDPDPPVPGTHFGLCCPPVPGLWNNDVSYPYAAVPDVIRFGLFIHDHTAAVDFLHDVAAPLAGELTAHLVQLAGDEELDWTPAAVGYAQELNFLCANPNGVGDRRRIRHNFLDIQRATARTRGPLISAEQLFTTEPDLVEPKWATMTDRGLNEVARHIWLAWNGRRPANLPDSKLLGIRSWLWKYRKNNAPNGLIPQDAGTWFASGHPKAGLLAGLTGALLHADTTDAQLAELATATTSDATVHGIALVGTDRHLRELREERRRQVRAQLAVARAQFAAAESVYNDVRMRRSALVARILAWGNPGDTDTSLGRDAGMSHTGVGKIRARLAAPDDGQPD